MFLVLHKYGDHGTMMPGDQGEDLIEVNIPIDLLGPFEENPRGTMIHLRNSMGSVIIKETTAEIRNAVAAMLSQVARPNTG